MVGQERTASIEGAIHVRHVEALHKGFSVADVWFAGSGEDSEVSGIASALQRNLLRDSRFDVRH